MSLAAQIIDQRVQGIATEFADQLKAEASITGDEQKIRSASFVYLVAKTILGLDDGSVMDGIVDGGNDFGVDAIYYDDPIEGEISITIIQGKYKKSLEGISGFPENGIIKLIDAITSLFDPNRNVTLNPRLRERVEEIRSFVAGGAIPRVSAIACNNGPSWSSEAEERIEASKAIFGDQVEWRHVGPDELLNLLQSLKKIEAKIQLIGNAIVEQFNYRRVLVGRMSVSELARLVDQFGDRLLEKNIRRYLGLAGNRVNEAVADTLKSADQRENFYFYNNGVTIVCSQFRHNALQQGSWQIQVDGLQIVNGGQTSRTIHQLSAELGPEIASAQVLVRIYELPDTDDDLVAAITYATNSQNPVDLRDLKANDSVQSMLAASISALGYGYRTKREDRSVSTTEFTSAVVAEAVLAVWRDRPHQARFSGNKHFGALYEKIFTPELNGAQAIIAALIMRLTENRRKRPPSDAPDFLVYGSRFVAMLVGKYLLEDLKIELSQLNHNNFDKARSLLEQNSQRYLHRGEADISSSLEPLFEGKERTLQRLSATFRRADLIEVLTKKEITALEGAFS